MRLSPFRAAAIAAPLLFSPAFAAPHYAPWSVPVNLGEPVNSRFAETRATLTKRGTSLYFASNRPCGEDDAVLDPNIWVAHRATDGGAWERVECLGINVDPTVAGSTPYEDSSPALSRDEHWLFFVSDRPGSTGAPGFFGRDIWVTWRANSHDDQAWVEPWKLAAPVNTDAAETGPTYFENEGGVPQLFFISTRSGLSGLFDILMVDVIEGMPAGAVRRVDEVNTDALVEAGASIGHNGLELFFFRGVPGTPLDIFTATRSDPHEPWSVPINLGPVNSTANEQGPSLSPDGSTLLFSSTRPGSIGGSPDIWSTTRVRDR